MSLWDGLFKDEGTRGTGGEGENGRSFCVIGGKGGISRGKGGLGPHIEREPGN